VCEYMDSEFRDWPHVKSVFKSGPVSASHKRDISERKGIGNSWFSGIYLVYWHTLLQILKGSRIF
jgi:hypothetical protein